MFDPQELERIRQAREEWEAQTLNPHLERAPEMRERFITTSSAEVGRLYTPEDTAGQDFMNDSNYPGQYPFTRGVYPTMHRGRLWTMRMFSGFGNAEDTNTRYRYLLEQGQTGLSVAFDTPTLYGRDTDHPIAAGEFGKCGVAISSLADMEILFDRIPLDKVTTSMTINSPAAVVWAMYIVAAEKQGVPWDQLGGTIQNDILKEYIAQNEYIFPPEPSMRLVVDTFEFGSKHLPRWNTVSISGYHIREAGSTALQELAFTLADGLAYVDAALERGLDIDDFSPRLSFFFNAHNDFFEEIAKYRAARRIWARKMREHYGAKDPRSWKLRFHTQTAGCSLTAQQPEINIVRVAIQALAAVLGGTQSLHTNSLDEALALPSEKAVTIALRTQQIIAHESGAANTIDPLGGSYYVEWLTRRMEEQCLDYFRRIDEFGGVIAGIRQGFFQQEIAESAYRYQKEIEADERVIVGLNDYVMDQEIEIALLRVDEESERRHMERLQRVHQERDSVRVGETLEALERAARGSENTMPYIVEAVRAYATLGEVCDVFRKVFGEYRQAAFM